MDDFAKLSGVATDELDRLFACLPDDLREIAEAVPVICEMLPAEDILEEGEEAGDLLGLFVGDTYAAESFAEDSMPTAIYLFLENIMDMAGGDMREFRREVRKTYLHEFGHYIDLGEDDLYLRGMD